MNNDNSCYETPQADISLLETEGIIASSNLENPKKGDDWNWN